MRYKLFIVSNETYSDSPDRRPPCRHYVFFADGSYASSLHAVVESRLFKQKLDEVYDHNSTGCEQMNLRGGLTWGIFIAN